MKKHTGYTLYKGPSLIDGSPIVVIATVESRNVKTGNMVQTWILRADMAPMAALAGADESICGACPHRPSLGGACYVDVSRAPSQVFKAYARGAYPDISDTPEAIAAIAAGRKVRLGAYGDPMAVPVGVWSALTAQAAGHTGYTHQWQSPERYAPSQFAGVLRLCMASADTPAELAKARALGFRTFRVRMADEPLAPREFACPASPEGGDKATCATCMACNGSARPSAASPAIVVHGSKAKRYITLRTVSA
jgi:hypothetical protein